jgi:heme/copper-type cytochrome/quinol oxidase subunit 2
MTSSEFRRLTETFIAENRLADDSVKPRRSDPVPGEGHRPAEHEAHGVERALASDDTPVDVYLMAYQWGYTPAVLRLEPEVRYRFRIMAVDVAHGASLHLGPAARVVRLRPGQLVEQDIVFAQEGEHLLYCTVYCGLNHDRMHGRIIVSKAEVSRHG